MSGIRKISKEKGVEICVNDLYSGKATKEIVRSLTESYGISKSTVEKWMQAARPKVEERQREDEAVRRRENEALIAESARKLNISRERVLEEYARIAFFDPKSILTVDGGLKPLSEIEAEHAAAIAGIESFDVKSDEGEILGTTRKIKLWDKKGALDSICKVMGYMAPVKVQPTGEVGGSTTPVQVVKQIIIVNGKEIEF